MAEKLFINAIDTDNRITALFSDKNLPRVARHGELYIVNGVLYIYADLENINQGRWFPLTNQKEIYSFSADILSDSWDIPITFHTDNMEIIIYDDVNKIIYPEHYNIVKTENNIQINFETPIIGQAYIIVNKVFDWIDSKIIVGDRNLTIAPNPDNINSYYIELDTEFIKILRDGLITIEKDITMNANAYIENLVAGNATLNTLNVETITSNTIDEITTYILSNNTRSTNIESDLTNEITRATTQENTLQSNIDIEKGRIDSILSASTADKDSFKEIVDLINSVDTTNDAVFAGYVLSNDVRSTNIESDLTNEITRATTAEGTLQTNLDTETVARIDGDNKLTSDLASEVTRAINTEFMLSEALGTESTRAIDAEAILTSNLNSEIDRAKSADGVLDGKISSEITRATTAESTLQSNIDAEATRATTKENTLQSNIDAYILSNDVRSTNIESDLTNEITRATNSETLIQNNLDIEITSRISAIQEINNKLLDLNSTILNTNTPPDLTELLNLINTEITRATSQENTLQSNIDTEKGRIDNILSMSTLDLDSFKEIVDLINTTGGVLNTISWDKVTNIPATFTPSTHTHNISEIIGLTDSFNAIGTFDDFQNEFLTIINQQ